MDYLRDPAAIYRESFARIGAEAPLPGLEGPARAVAMRVIHACGMTDIADDLYQSPGAAEGGQVALSRGAPVLADCRMVAEGIIRSRLPAENAVICTLNDEGMAEAAKKAGTTRSAMAVEAWRPHLGGAVAVIGNAPTALFRLLEIVEEGAPPPALIIGMAVGFVGAAEAKQALIDSGLPCIVVRGRRGGSAMAAAALNALATGGEG